MSAMSDYLENKLLDHALGVAAYTMPTTVYLALFTADPGDADSGTELSGNGYSRNACAFDSAASGATSNSAEELFTASGGDWGTITHWGIYDASTVGNLLVHGAFDVSREVLDGDTIRVQAGDLDISAD